MTAIDVATASCAALAAWLALSRRPTVAVRAAARPTTARGSALVRLRLPLTLLAGLGTASVLGGPVGWLGGAIAAVIAWRVLGRVESPALVRRREQLRRELPGAVDLLVASFRAGAAPGPSLDVVARAIGGPVGEEFGALHARLGLGTEPAHVWRDLARHPELGPLGRALGRAHETGASVTTAGERLAQELRERSRAEVEERARSVSTKAAAPLGACFLPAFVLVGIVPLVAGLVGALGLVR